MLVRSVSPHRSRPRSVVLICRARHGPDSDLGCVAATVVVSGVPVGGLSKGLPPFRAGSPTMYLPVVSWPGCGATEARAIDPDQECSPRFLHRVKGPNAMSVVIGIDPHLRRPSGAALARGSYPRSHCLAGIRPPPANHSMPVGRWRRMDEDRSPCPAPQSDESATPRAVSRVRGPSR